MNARRKRLACAAAVALVYALAVTAVFQYHYFVNDDLIIRDILSGRYSGTADAHICNIIYPFAYLVMLAYRVFPAVDVWGVLMVGLNYICLFAVLDRSLGLAKKRYLLTTGCVLVLFSCAALYHICFFTFTATGTVCAATALFLYVTTPPEKTRVGTYLPSLLLMLVSFCIRKDTLLMVLPFFGVWLIYLFLTEKEKKKKFFNLLRPVLALAVCCAALWWAHVNAFSSPEWQDFLEFRDLRKSVHDFSGYPSYEENKGFYDNLGISYEEYLSVENKNMGGGNTVLDYGVGIRSILAQVGEQERADRGAEERFSGGFRSIAYLLNHTIIPGRHNLTLGLLLTVCLSALLARRKRWLLLAVLYTGVAGVVLEMLLFAWGGHISWVVLRMLTALMILWPGCVGAHFLGSPEKRDALLPAAGRRSWYAAGLCVCIAMGCLTAGSWLRQIKADGSVYALRSNATQELYRYCKADPDRTYFQPAYAISDHTDTLDGSGRFDCSFNNLVILGGWNAFSPEYRQSLTTMGLEYDTIEASILNQDNVGVISQKTYISSILGYLQWKYGDRVSWEIVDTIETDGLGTIGVYDFDLLPE